MLIKALTSVLLVTLLRFSFISAGNGKIDGGKNATTLGKPAGNGQFPFVVFIRTRVNKDTIAACTGTLVTNKFVLTAAHCIKGTVLNAYKVYAGSSTRKRCQSRYVRAIYPHPCYFLGDLRSRIVYNVGLLQLRKPFDTFPSITTTRMVFQGKNNRKIERWAGEDVLMVGYGENETLRFDLGVVKKGGQKRWFLQVDFKDGVACSGDNGGPLLLKSDRLGTTGYLQIGLMGRGNDELMGTKEVKCFDGRPTEYFVRLDFVRDWIDRVVEAEQRLNVFHCRLYDFERAAIRNMKRLSGVAVGQKLETWFKFFMFCFVMFQGLVII